MGKQARFDIRQRCSREGISDLYSNNLTCSLNLHFEDKLCHPPMLCIYLDRAEIAVPILVLTSSFAAF